MSGVSIGEEERRAKEKVFELYAELFVNNPRLCETLIIKISDTVGQTAFRTNLNCLQSIFIGGRNINELVNCLENREQIGDELWMYYKYIEDCMMSVSHKIRSDKKKSKKGSSNSGANSGSNSSSGAMAKGRYTKRRRRNHKKKRKSRKSS